MTRKVIYVSVMRLSDKVTRDWYVNLLIENGIQVEYWDLASLVYGEDGHESKGAAYLRVPRSYSDVVRRLRSPDNRNASYVMVATYEGRTVRLFRLMSRYGCRMLFISWGAMPAGDVRRLRKILLNPAVTCLNVIRRAKAAIYRSLGLVRPFDIVFAAGEVLVAAASPAKRVVPINLIDYDHYRSVRGGAERIIVERYAVFLDIFLPYQSDLKIVGITPINPESYYASICRYFNLIERMCGVKVVIAAHPKAIYSPAQFGGRLVLQGVTPELVRDADFAISHHSTSVSYAVLNIKPVAFIYTREMASLYEFSIVRQVRGLAAYLNSPAYDIDEITSVDFVAPTVDRKRYDAFKYDFLTTHVSEHTPTGEIFLRELTATVQP